MDRREFFQSAGACGLIPFMPDWVDEEPYRSGKIVPQQLHFKRGSWWTWWNFEYHIWLNDSHLSSGHRIVVPCTWYKWPRDRVLSFAPAQLQKFSDNPITPVPSYLVPTFNLQLTGGTIWSHIQSAIKAEDKNLRKKMDEPGKEQCEVPRVHCIIAEIMGLKGEYGICCNPFPMKPLTDQWFEREKAIGMKLKTQALNRDWTVME